MLFSVVLICLVASVVGTGTYAYVSDYEHSEDKYFAGGSPLDVTVDGKDDPDVATYFKVEGVMPGDEGSVEINLCNTGSVDGTADLHFIMTVNDDNGIVEPEDDCDPPNNDGYDGTPDGDLCQNLMMRVSVDLDDNGSYETVIIEGAFIDIQCINSILGDLDPDDCIGLKIEWWVPTTVGNIIMTDICGFDIEFSLVQNDEQPTPTPTPTPTPIDGGGLGGGGGGWSDICPETFTVNFNGKITETTMTYDGRLCGNCYAPSPDGLHLFEIDFLTRVLDSEGDPVTLIDITEVHSPPLPPYTVLVGSMYEFAPSGVTFDKQVRLTLGYNVDQLPADALRVLMAYYDSEEVWTELETESTQVADIGTLTGVLNHLTIFATLAEVPGFEVSNLSVAPSRREIWPFLTFAVVTGEEAVVSVDVANVGNHEASHTVSLEVNGETKANHDVFLSPGQSEDVVFTLSDNAPGRHVVVVEDLIGEFTHSLWINWWLIIGLGAALLIIIVLVFFGVRWYRRRVVA